MTPSVSSSADPPHTPISSASGCGGCGSQSQLPSNAYITQPTSIESSEAALPLHHDRGLWAPFSLLEACLPWQRQSSLSSSPTVGSRAQAVCGGESCCLVAGTNLTHQLWQVVLVCVATPTVPAALAASGPSWRGLPVGARAPPSGLTSLWVRFKMLVSSCSKSLPGSIRSFEVGKRQDWRLHIFCLLRQIYTDKHNH